MLKTIIISTIIVTSAHAAPAHKTTSVSRKQATAKVAIHPSHAPETAGGIESPKSFAEEYVREEATKRFGQEHVMALVNLINGESHFRPDAVNSTSGACGIFQSYPCQKMGCSLTDVKCQTKWGLDYLERRYKNPTNAYEFKKANGYY